MEVRKRNGKVVEFNGEKIQNAIAKAFKASHEDDAEGIKGTYNSVLLSLERMPMAEISVEQIQDQVEQALMARGYPEVAKSYILYRDKRNRMREISPDPNAISDYIHVSKYAKYREDLGRRETYQETVDRVQGFHTKRFPALAAQISDAFDLVRKKKVLPSMRSMQFAGLRAEQHNASIYNCSFTLIDRPRVFQEIFYLLLTGCGVGYSLHREWVHKMPELKKWDRSVRHFVVEDTIEGWADCIGALVKGYMDGSHPEFDYSKIRLEGSPLRTSGGKAPGHVPLRRCVERARLILESARGRHLSSLECHDIICHIAEAVLSGGIRRSSLIALFDYDDEEMFHSKDPKNFRYPFEDDPGLNSQRAMANNSAIILRSWDEKKRSECLHEITRTAEQGWAEPGFYFADSYEHGTNPCGEIGLHPVIAGDTGFAFCNLCEINCSGLENQGDFKSAVEAATFIGTLQASCTRFDYLGKTTECIAERDALLGVSLTGIQDAPWIKDDADLLSSMAKWSVEYNEHIASVIGINPAKRITTVKPSGTASLELGCVGSGIHPHHAKRYFRRVTANPLEPAARHFRMINPHMVEEKPNGDWCITFPIEAPDGAIVLDDLDASTFLDDVLRVKKHWVNPGSKSQPFHNVSCTVTLSAEETKLVVDTIDKNSDDITAMSFAPRMLDKGIPFCPREGVRDEADLVRWQALIQSYMPIDWSQFAEDGKGIESRSQVVACAGGACEL